MTPERLAEIKRGYHVGCVAELLAEIDRLTAENARLSKVVDQAIGWIDEGDHFIISDSGNYLELAAELEARSR